MRGSTCSRWNWTAEVLRIPSGARFFLLPRAATLQNRVRILILMRFWIVAEEVAWLTIEDFNLKLNRT